MWWKGKMDIFFYINIPIIQYFPCRAEVPVDKSQMSQAVLVCTAHIHWDPEFCDVKLIQVSSGTL